MNNLIRIIFFALMALPLRVSAMGYIFSGYEKADFFRRVEKALGDYKEHPAFIAASPSRTLRWMKADLAANYRGIYSLRESTKSDESEGKKILSLTFTGELGEEELNAIRIIVFSEQKSEIKDNIRNIEKTYHYTINSFYGIKNDAYRAHLSEIKNNNIIFNSINEIIELLHQRGIINQYNAAGSEKYQEYRKFFEEAKEKERRIASRLRADCELIGLYLDGKMGWSSRKDGRRYVSNTMTRTDITHLSELVQQSIGIEGRIIPSQSKKYRFRLALKEEDFRDLMETLLIPLDD